MGEAALLGRNPAKHPGRWKTDPAKTRYRGAVKVKRAADLYAQG
jgi:hypothetical protein